MIDKFLCYNVLSLQTSTNDQFLSPFETFDFSSIRIDSWRFNTLWRHYTFNRKDINPEMIILLYISRLVYRYPPTCSPRHSLETLKLAGSKSRKGARLPQSYVSRIQYRMKIATFIRDYKERKVRGKLHNRNRFVSLGEWLRIVPIFLLQIRIDVFFFPFARWDCVDCTICSAGILQRWQRSFEPCYLIMPFRDYSFIELFHV